MAHRKSSECKVIPSERSPGKFEAIQADGKVLPYAYRTEAEAWAALEGPAAPEPESTEKTE